MHHGHDGLAVFHPGVGIALGGQAELFEFPAAQFRVFRMEFAQLCIDTGDEIRLLGVLVVVQIQAGAERPVASPLFFALNAKFRAIIDGRNAPERIY